MKKLTKISFSSEIRAQFAINSEAIKFVIKALDDGPIENGGSAFLKNVNAKNLTVEPDNLLYKQKRCEMTSINHQLIFVFLKLSAAGSNKFL